MCLLKPVSALTLSIVVMKILSTTLAQGICTLHNGSPGRCVDIRECESVRRTYRHKNTVKCNTSGKFPVVCCPTSASGKPEPIEDISPPTVNFDCGQNAKQTYGLYTIDFLPLKTLRQGSVNLAPSSSIPATAQASNGRRPGIPQSAMMDLSVHIERVPPPPPPGDPSPPRGLAVGGVKVQKNSWPWMALLGEKIGNTPTWFCAGVLISDQWILSALHCFLTKTAEVVRLGEHDYNDDNDGAVHEDFGVEKPITYPEYLHPQAYHDLALLKLDRKVILKPTIKPVCLPWGRESTESLVDQQVTLTGWGDTEFGGSPSSVMQEVNVTVFSSQECDKSYSTLLDYSISWPRGINDNIICAGDRNGGRDACQGDSGGPIVSRNSAGRFTLAGIVSRGYVCGHKDFPGLYVNIRHSPYLAWIKNIVF
ncbi:hypothetical protein OTU49_005093 [Cherax quadricarinatus]|uniref:CLIP domain-containing serine protease n=1 Tax=Cherax quadricarinatus TaxID=27406 RepID=A0AAW0XAD6_CHEQU